MLPFVAKVMERVIAFQLQVHLVSNHLCDPFSVVFTHSGALIALISLDCSFTFDTGCLFSDTTSLALSWFNFYLTDREYFISVQKHISSSSSLTHSELQGSICVPLCKLYHNYFITIYSSYIVEIFYAVTSNLHQILWKTL